ncbi:ApeA N-terminal domain 1-containing protein [Aestuariibaculum marinum]|uniref:ApeA N-terminal domain-containing protein n=1 Tax=Aestuariibaculum marinum TaxID=2683592 RepID=A0A8J6PTS8_9FLAO|nr:HEPN domain-containing protein [Aestuariibaculum marinum]MBD0822916.1 hypothetical protein [Aestuariibaculum marinum]
MEYYNKYFDGIFWIPNNEDDKIISTLHIDQEGKATISSLESFNNTEFINDLLNIDLVLGYVNCQDESKTYSIKLYNLYKSHETLGYLNKVKYTSNDVLIAKAIDKNINSEPYTSIMLNSVLIDNWVSITGFNFKKFNHEKNFEITHLYNQPDTIQLYNDEKINIYIYFRAQSRYHNRRKSSITEEVFINIEVSELKNIEELNKIRIIIDRLLNLILFKPFISSVIELRTIDKINYRMIKKFNEFDSNLTKSIDFTLFKNNSQNIFSKWFKKQNKLDLAIVNFFSVFGRKGVLIENKFLTYISILENFHKNHIKSEAYLKTRLKYLLEKSSISQKIMDINSFADKLKITRNYHAHLEEKHKSKSLTGLEIHYSNYLLEFLIREIFLNEIGIKENLSVPPNVEKCLSIINQLK